MHPSVLSLLGLECPPTWRSRFLPFNLCLLLFLFLFLILSHRSLSSLSFCTSGPTTVSSFQSFLFQPLQASPKSRPSENLTPSPGSVPCAGPCPAKPGPARLHQSRSHRHSGGRTGGQMDGRTSRYPNCVKHMNQWKMMGK